ncbi:hypothetical protein [Nonomuraea sp. NPDC023979]|uniref:hypothetical protein n=1 Tax=Nonomuraea sp. NPDC023979 TaxID=3154796 RepID=UPI00340987EA
MPTPIQADITARAERARAMIQPVNGSNQEVARHITDALLYAHSRDSRRNPTTTGQILRDAVVETAKLAQADDTNMRHEAPGMMEEAGWLIGELLSAADEQPRQAAVTGNAPLLLFEGVIGYLLNRPRDERTLDRPGVRADASTLTRQLIDLVRRYDTETFMAILSEALGGVRDAKEV